ncbi:MAG: hypothetical protein K2R98_04810 [Gemmataceae bacterium]|nr:hypothetical protein [Gemmataceae bacterium]
MTMRNRFARLFARKADPIRTDRRTRLSFECLESRNLLSFTPLGEFTVDGGLSSTSPQVARNASGAYVVVWSEGGIQAQAYNADGMTNGGPIAVSGSGTFPHVAMDAAGDFVVAWQDGTNINVSLYNADTSLNQSDVVTTGAASGFGTSVGMDAAGNFVVTWVGSTYYYLEAARYDTAFNPNFFTVESSNGGNFGPTVAVNASGSFVVGWADASSFFVQPYDSTATPTTALPITVDSNPTSSTSTVAIDDAGDFVVAWTGNDADSYGIYAQRYDSSGSPLLGVVQVNTTTTDRQSGPSVAMDANGDLVIAWSSRNQENPGNNDYGVYAQLFDRDGVAYGTEFLVNTASTNSESEASVSMDALGNFVVVWSNSDEGLGTSAIEGQRYRADAQVLFATDPTDAMAGAQLDDFQVQVFDPFGNDLIGATVTLTGSPTLPSTFTAVTGEGGYANFGPLDSNVSIQTAGTYTLTASIAAYPQTATSGSFDITPDTAGPVLLTFQTELSATTAGQVIGGGSPVPVLLTDQFGNPLSGYVVTLTGAPFVSGGIATTDASGLAMFSDLVINQANSYTLRATAAGLSGFGDSQLLFINAAAADHLVFNAQPLDALAGDIVTATGGGSGSVEVYAADVYGNLVTIMNVDVTLSLVGGPAGATIAAGGTVNSLDGGVISFTNLVITTAGTYRLSASGGGFSTLVDSSSFTISPLVASQMVITGYPNTTPTGDAQPLAVSVQDVFGNVVTTYTGTITLTLSDPAALVTFAGSTTPVPNNTYTFSGTDDGIITFAVTLNTVGTQSIVVTSNDGFAKSIPNISVVQRTIALPISEKTDVVPATGTVDISLPAITATVSGGNEEQTTLAIVATYGTTNPTTTPVVVNGESLDTLAFTDFRLVNPTADTVAVLTFTIPAGTVNPKILFYTSDGTWVVVSPQARDGNTITVTLDSTSTPNIFQLDGTVFTIAIPIPTTTPSTPSTPGTSTGSSATTTTTANVIPLSAFNQSGTSSGTPATFSSSNQLTLTLTPLQQSSVTTSQAALTGSSGGSDADVKETRGKGVILNLDEVWPWVGEFLPKPAPPTTSPPKTEAPGVEPMLDRWFTREMPGEEMSESIETFGIVNEPGDIPTLSVTAHELGPSAAALGLVFVGLFRASLACHQEDRQRKPDVKHVR